MAKRPWMPLYTGDYLKDTPHLMATESGAYLHLLMHYWDRGGPIPDDDKLLCRIAKVHPPHWPRIRKVLECFFSLTKTPGSWYHQRVELEISKQSEISNKRKEAALQKHSNSSANAEQMHTQSQSHLVSKEDKKETPLPPKGGRKRKTPKTQIDPNWQLSEKGMDYAINHGWSTGFIAEQSETFRNHCLKKASTFADWEAAWRNWVLSPYNDPAKRAPASSKPNEPMLQLVPPDPNWIELDSDEWYAWRKHRGGIAFPLDRNRGWIAPSRWPPGYKANGVAS